MDLSEMPWGCAHYKRRSKFVTPCCNKVYSCRFCHDEAEKHEVLRHEVIELECTVCGTRQPLQPNCQSCNTRFGRYTCLECKLFDDVDKKQYHCNGCGICRAGGRDRFFHCDRCNMCLPISIQYSHTCVENVSRSCCPVCLEIMHSSRLPCHIPKCGHLLHRHCFEEMLKAGLFACPICCKSLVDMSKMWRTLDDESENTLMPDDLKFQVDILCKDCVKKSKTNFHVVGLKCSLCGSYNTCRVSSAEYENSQRIEADNNPSQS